MISSAIARLSNDPASRNDVIRVLQSQVGIDTGDLIDDRLLPLTIEAGDATELESLTRWLQDLSGVETVDIVYVHLESGDSHRIATP